MKLVARFLVGTAVAVSLLVAILSPLRAAEAPAIPDYTTPDMISMIFTTVSAIGALDHCEQSLGYKITGKTDEVAYMRFDELLRTYAAIGEPQEQRAQFFAVRGRQVMSYAQSEGIWVVGSVVLAEDGVTKKVKGTRVDLDVLVCASVEEFLRDQMKPGALLSKVSRLELEATAPSATPEADPASK